MSSLPDLYAANVELNSTVVFGINMTLINSLTDYSKLVNFMTGGRLYLEVVLEY